MRRAWMAVVGTLGLLGLACGGGNSSGSSSSASRSQGSAEADAIRACLQRAAIETSIDPNKQLGVTDPFVRIVAHETPGDDSTITELAVFESAPAAIKARPAFALTDTDSPTNTVVGPVVVRFGIVPHTGYRDTILNCVSTGAANSTSGSG